jgi:hypothetical protein
MFSRHVRRKGTHLSFLHVLTRAQRTRIHLCPQHWLLCHLGLFKSEFEFENSRSKGEAPLSGAEEQTARTTSVYAQCACLLIIANGEYKHSEKAQAPQTSGQRAPLGGSEFTTKAATLTRRGGGRKNWYSTHLSGLFLARFVPAPAFWFTRYLIVVPRPMPAAPRWFLIVVYKASGLDAA